MSMAKNQSKLRAVSWPSQSQTTSWSLMIVSAEMEASIALTSQSI